MIIATWNVNSIRARLDRVITWLARRRPDVLCLQETKVADEAFPTAELAVAGYHSVTHGQRTYNGVAILSRTTPDEIRRGLGDGDDPQSRLVAARFGDVWVLSAYFPNGGVVGTAKWDHKLEWMARLRAHLEREYTPDVPLALCGDFNVAPDDRDVARPERWDDTVLAHPEAREALERVREWGFVDVVRRRFPAGGVYSWWDYRAQAFARDDGLRIDHVFATRPLAALLAGAAIDRDERLGGGASDHVPVRAEFDLGRQPDADPTAPHTGSSGTPYDEMPHDEKPHDEEHRAGDRGGAGGGGSARPRVQRVATAPGAESSPGDTGGRPRLVLVDGHSVAYRAFYGMPLYDRRGAVSFATRSGEFTNAVYGFTNMLLKTWNELRPDRMAVAFDRGLTFRDALYADYKATRTKMPDELTPQIDRIEQVVEAFGIPIVAVEGYEADDLLGTLSRRATEDGFDVVIVTGDSDAFQLVGPHVRVLAPGRLWTETAMHDEASIRARYGLTPAQLIDYKALVGDTSDNIPGVKGVGAKTAAPLLQQHGTLEAIYEHLAEVEPARARTALAAGRDVAFLSRELVTIRRDVPIEIAWEDCAVREYDRDRVEDLFDELEFRGIRARLPEGGRSSGRREARANAAGAAAGAAAGRADSELEPWEVGASELEAGEPEAGADGDAGAGDGSGMPGQGARGRAGRAAQLALFGAGGSGAARRAEAGGVTRAVVVDTPEALAGLVDRLTAAPLVSLDVETSGLDSLRADLVGICLAVESGSGYYVPVGHLSADRQLPLADVAAALGPLLGDPARPKVAHNAKFDMSVLRRYGMEVRGLVYDTMLAEFLIDPGARLGLKALARSRLGIEMTEITELIGTGKKQISMDRVPVPDAAPYGAADVDMTLRLVSAQEPELASHQVRHLLDEIELPLVPVLIDMEMAGIMIDRPHLSRMSERLARRMAEIEAQVYEMVGRTFNLGSPTQLAEVLFHGLGLEAPRARQTRTGRESVAVDVLDSMHGRHPAIDLVLEHRQLAKLKGTYIDALPALADPETSRVHTSFNQTGAVSGRLSSQDPNLQNIPIRTDLGREVRRAFVAPPGWRLISADYSQVELRIAAHISGDANLRSAFELHHDIHRATAAIMFDVAPEAVTADQRSFAKRVNFGVLYGMGTRSLSERAGVPMNVARQFIDAYFAGFPEVRRYLDDTKRTAKERGYVETLLGRRRYFPILATETRDARTNVMQRAAEREAINHPMQGTAADIIKIAMIRVHRALAERGLAARLLLQVHDELVLEAPEAEAADVAQLVKETMEGAYVLDPPLVAEVGVGGSWAEVK